MFKFMKYFRICALKYEIAATKYWLVNNYTTMLTAPVMTAINRGVGD